MRGDDVLADGAHELRPVEQAVDLLRAEAVRHERVVEDLLERAPAMVLANHVLGDEILLLRALEQERKRRAQDVDNASHQSESSLRPLAALRFSAPQ